MRRNRGLSFKEAAGDLPWSEDGRVLLSQIKDSLLQRRMTKSTERILRKSVYHIEETEHNISITITSK